MSSLPRLIDETNAGEFLKSFDNILTDCDGVLWSCNTIINNANNVINKLQTQGKNVFYLTNNSTKSRELLLSKCQDLGFRASKDSVISSSYITAQYLKNKQFKEKVYVIGSKGLGNEFDNAGISHIGIGPQDQPENVFDLQDTVKLDPNVKAVVVGFDPFFNLGKMMLASSYLIDPDCIFISTNKDYTFPLKDKNLVFPGTGVLVTAVETATGRKSEVMGKPSEKMFTVLKDLHNLDPKRCLMIGDRCDTDILFGKNCNMRTLVVLTGVTEWRDIEKWYSNKDEDDKKLLADYYLPSLGVLEKYL